MLGRIFIHTIKQAKRLIIIVVGFTVLLFGIALIVLPGPAFIVIPAGLAILGTEFLWARSLLKHVKQRTLGMAAYLGWNFGKPRPMPTHPGVPTPSGVGRGCPVGTPTSVAKECKSTDTSVPSTTSVTKEFKSTDTSSPRPMLRMGTPTSVTKEFKSTDTSVPEVVLGKPEVVPGTGGDEQVNGCNKEK